MTQMNRIGSSMVSGNGIEKAERAGQKRDVAAAATSKSGTATAADAAQLSGAGSLLAAAAATDDVRAGKVAALKAAIDNGTYNVPAADVADTLIRNMLE